MNRPPRPQRSTPRVARVARVTLGTLLGITCAIVAFLAWSTVMPGTSFSGPLPPLDEREARYARELRASVEELAGVIGERNLANPRELERAADQLEKELGAAGYVVRRQSYLVAGQTAHNLEVELRGKERPEEIVIVGGHYDSAMGAPGADDNATGAAATLVLARAFAGRRFARTLRFVELTNEEPPYFWTEAMGSVVYARACKARGEAITAMISVESVGYFRDDPGSQRYPFPFDLIYPSTGSFIAFVGNSASRSLVRESVGLFRTSARIPSEGAALPGFIPGAGWSDQWSFWQEGYPALMVTDTAPFRNPHYHTTTDTVETLDFARAARVVYGLERVIEALALPVP